MAPDERGGLISVVVVHCPRPGEVDAVELRLPAGATLRDAVLASRIADRHPGADPERAGIWGRARPADAVLRDGDRVELYRPLRVDPKEARRLRYRGQRESRAKAKGARADAAAASGSRSR